MTNEVSHPFHRKIGLRCHTGVVEGEICDNMHHFRVWLHHDGKKVLQTQSEAIRYPWSTCPQAGSELEQLVGMPLDESSTAVGRIADATVNCTHLFDMAGLMVAHAAHRRPPWQYHCEVSEAGADQQLATLTRNRESMLSWRIYQGVIEAEPPFQGCPPGKAVHSVGGAEPQRRGSRCRIDSATSLEDRFRTFCGPKRGWQCRQFEDPRVLLQLATRSCRSSVLHAGDDGR